MDLVKTPRRVLWDGRIPGKIILVRRDEALKISKTKKNKDKNY